MNMLDSFVRLYGLCRNYGMPIWVMMPIRRLVRLLYSYLLPYYLEREVPYSNKTCDVIVSFTSFPKRINNVWQVVECMKRQTIKPQKIILWLSRQQFPSLSDIPLSLSSRIDDCFEIRMVDEDYRSHKKYYYAAKEYPNKLLFLIDDDLYYPTNIIERSLECLNTHREYVICNYAFSIAYDDNGCRLPYKRWKELFHDSEDESIFLGTGGGTLFCPNRLYKDLLNIDVAMSLTPIADDVWINAMIRLSNVPKVLLKHGLIVPIINKNNATLCSQNVGDNMNDKQIDNLESYYQCILRRRIFDKSMIL